MKKVVLTLLKIAGIVLLVLILLIAGFLFWLSQRPFVPNNYTETVDSGGVLEAKYDIRQRNFCHKRCTRARVVQ